jgi:spoIIIJ-associated protein
LKEKLVGDRATSFVEDANDDGDEGRTADGEQEAESARADDGDLSSEGVARLEREGDVAADYLEELLDIADVDGDIDLDVEGSRAMVAVVGGDLQHLVGAEGEVLEALQELTRLAVYRETGERSRLMLDVAGHRAQRRSDLIALTEKIVSEVVASGESARLEPMTPFERKVVHDTVAAKGLTSESEGEEPERRVVIQPA